MARRDYGPGEHGQKRRKMSDYANQLAAKQKLKKYYANMTEKQFRRAYEEASRTRGDTAETLIGLLERRLVIAIIRFNFVPTYLRGRLSSITGLVMFQRLGVKSRSYRLGRGRHHRAQGAARRQHAEVSRP